MSGNIGRDLFLTQVQYLEEQLASFQLHCEAMEDERKQLVSQGDTKQKALRAKTDRLRSAAAANERKVEGWLEQLEAQRAASRIVAAERLQVGQQKQELQEHSGRLQQQSTVQAVTVEQQEAGVEAMQRQGLESKQMLLSLREEQEPETRRVEAAMRKQTQKVCGGMTASMEASADRRESEERAPHRQWLSHHQDMQSEARILQEQTDTVQETQADLELSQRVLQKELPDSMQQKTRINEELVRLLRMIQQQITDSGALTAQRSSTEKQHPSRTRAPVPEEEDTSAHLEAELQEEEERRRQMEAQKQEAAVILRYILGRGGGSEADWITERLLEILESCAPPPCGQEEELHA